MSNRILDELFESPVKVKILKLFLHSPRLPLTLTAVSQRVRVKKGVSKRVINRLVKAGILKLVNIRSK